MTEGTKTGIFCGTAVVIVALATFVAWPSASAPDDNFVDRLLFEKFQDPLAAASLKIVTFDEEKGELGTFEVRKDRETNLWTIPSRDGYPADAIEQMKDAANALVGVRILDVQTTNAEDHDDLGVIEPKVETLEVGDEGVGRLVVFKDEKQETLASLIVGDQVKGDDSKRYVRIPNQDPVYVIKFDDSPLTTKFTDWIEDDLLKLSSIDIENVTVKDYTASITGGGISVTRNYTAELTQDGTDWKLDQLLEYDPKDPRIEPKEVDVAEDAELNKTKFNEMKNALDDLKIVGVFRKPEGVSATLKASKDLMSDSDAVASLAQRGFYPVNVGLDGEAEILSANGELSVSLKDGVRYLLRFGNIAGVSQDAGDQTSEDEEDESGVNRYLFVTTMVDESKFPAPELQAVPQTLEELDALLNPPKEIKDDADSSEASGDSEGAEESADPAMEANKKEDAGDTEDAAAPSDASKEAPADMKEKSEEPATESNNTDSNNTDSNGPDSNGTDSNGTDSTGTEATSGETEASGDGEASGSGQAMQDASAADDAEAASDTEAKTEPAEQSDESASEPAADASKEEPKDETVELTEEELQERLEAEQEKITKENQRKLDERKDQLEEAERKVRELNERFADWYYVIPESTYSKLQIKRDELFKEDASDSDDPGTSANPLDGGPQFNIPGFPGN